MKVTQSIHFNTQFNTLSPEIQGCIADFVIHVQKNGLAGLPGKCKPSSDIPPTDPDYEEKKRFADTHGIHHYHIGYPRFEETKHGRYKTSEYCVFFKVLKNRIRLVKVDIKPIMLPTLEEMFVNNPYVE